MKRQSRPIGLAYAAVWFLGAMTGCQSGPGGIATPSMFSQQSLAERRESAAQQPMARSKMVAAPGDLSAAAEPAAAASMPGIALASYQEGLPAPGRPMQSMPNMAPAMPQPTPMPQMRPNAVPESYSVPREPIGQAPSYVNPAAPAVGSPYQNASHGRILGALHGNGPAPAQHGAGQCACCTPGKAYRPLFPHKNAMLAGACPPGPAPVDASCQPCATECIPEARCIDPQEYIYDGGDRDPQVRLREDMSQVGLDPEDTVIQYTTKTGVTEVQAGCRVAIYAPRFGAVRKRTGVLTSDLALRPQAAMLPHGPGMLREQMPPVNVMQPIKPVSKDTVRVVEAFRERQRPLPSELVLPMGVLSDAFKPYEDLDIIRNGDLRGTDPAKLALAAAAARIWTNIDELQVIIDGQDAVVVTDLKQPREYTLYEYKGARVRICKVASENIANPGDTISFTIRYDNVGDQPVSNLVVTDSLSPRLEYVDATQQSSLPAQFSTTPNEVGSSILRWEINQELKPGEGGFVRFDTKVR